MGKLRGLLWKDAKRALRFEVKDVANFLSKLYKDGKQGSVVDTTITILDSTRGLAAPEVPELAQNEVIKKLRRAAKRGGLPKSMLKNRKPISIPFYSTSILQRLARTSWP